MSEGREFFEDLWRQGDYWELETSVYDQRRYDLQVDLVSDRRYRRALEIGCGAGAFSVRLQPLVDELLAVDISEEAIARAQRLHGELQGVEFRTADAMDDTLLDGGPWDLVVVAETIYYLGWQHTLFDVAWFVRRILLTCAPGARLLLSNTMLDDEKGLLSPFLIRTYRDLVRNVGFELEREELYREEKDGFEMKALVSLFAKPT